MTDFLPLFPLPLVVFPGEQLNLHIFEPRYKQLVREAEQNGTTFGIPAFIDEQVMEVGTEIRLLSIEKQHDHRKKEMRTEGIQPFRILEFYRQAPNKLYAGADIRREENRDGGDPIVVVKILELAADLFELLNVNKKLPVPEQFYAFDIAHHVGFSLQQEYAFLCLPDETQRQAFMLEHLERMLPAAREMERLRERARMNGHFKNIIPPRL